MSQPARRSKLPTCLLALLALVCLIIIALIAIPGYINQRAVHQFGPASPALSAQRHFYFSTLLLLHRAEMTRPMSSLGAEVSLAIDQGESVPSIAEKLHQAGLIPNAVVFQDYLQYTGLDTTLKAGEYKLNSSLTPIEIAQAIQSSVSADVTLTILPGWRAEEIANSLPTSGYDITAEEFYTAIHTRQAGYSFSSCQHDDSLEGYLFPGSYTLPRASTINDLLPAILSNFDRQLNPELIDGIAAQGLDLCQAVTLASIVQREAMVEDEMPLIASVFYNRLRNGSVLASDPTVQYALGYNPEQGTWWTNPLSKTDLQIDSPYNTYLYAGLPPGPISNPGLAALKAVAFPAQTPYYYFRATCDGSGRHVFAETFDEHVANACP